MDFIKFCKSILCKMDNLESQISIKSRFTTREFSEILQTARRENVNYLEQLSRITKLSAFDMSFLLSSVKLNPERIAIIKQASEMYKESEFQEQGQTFSDFIFKVAANIELLNNENLELFKELAKCKNDVYDFGKVLKNPTKYLAKQTHEMKFAFEKVFY